MNDLPNVTLKYLSVYRMGGIAGALSEDVLSVEEPFEIRLSYGGTEKKFSITMPTPGQDHELALEFLFTEGIISAGDEVLEANHLNGKCPTQNQNIIFIRLIDHAVPRLLNAARNFYTSSSCGVCGKSSIQSISTVSPYACSPKTDIKVPAALLYHLPYHLAKG